MLPFTVAEKQKIKMILLWITTLGQASIALYLPSLPQIAHSLQVSDTAIKQTITVFIVGCGASPIVYGALTDRYGRKPILLISLLIACTGYTLNITAQNLYLFLVARLLSGIGCGGLLIVGRSIIRDVFTGRELASASSYLSMGFAIGFGISPTLGAYLANHFGFRADFVFLLLAGLLISCVVLYGLPETNHNKDNQAKLSKFLKKTLVDYIEIVKNLPFVRFLGGGLLAYGVVLAYNVMTPLLILRNFSLSTMQYGYLAILMGIPYYSAASLNRNLVIRFGISRVCKIGYIFMILSGAFMCLAHFLFPKNLLYIILPMMLAIFGQAFIFSNTISGALQQFPPRSAGKASAIFSGLQMLIVGWLSSIMALLPNKNALSLAVVIILLGFGTAIILPAHND